FERITRNIRIKRRHSFNRINQNNRDISPFQTLARHDYRQLLSQLIGLAFATYSGSVDETEVAFGCLQHGIDRVASGTRNWRNDHTVFTENPVKQRRLTDVWASNDGKS